MPINYGSIVSYVSSAALAPNPSLRQRLVILVKSSRSLGWIFGPILYGIGVLQSSTIPKTPGALAISAAQVITLSFPLCIVIFGVNDIYDYSFNLLNPRKSTTSLEGGVLPPSHHLFVRRAAVMSSVIILTTALFPSLYSWREAEEYVSWQLYSPAFSTAALIALGWEYSAPPIRLKEVPVLDSISNGIVVWLSTLAGFTSARVLRGKFRWELADIPTKGYALGLVTASVHSLGAAADIETDLASGQRTIATVLGRRACALIGAAAYAIALSTEGSLSIFAVYLFGGLMLMISACINPSSTSVHRTFQAVVYWTMVLAVVWFGACLTLFVRTLPPLGYTMEAGQRGDAETATIDVSNAIGPDKEKELEAYSRPQIPDGGTVAWLTVFGALKSSSEIAWIGSTQLCLQFVMGLVSGKLFDEGYFHWSIGLGSLLYVFCLFMLSLAKENQYYQVFLPQAVGMSIALGLLFLPAIGVISHHFARRRALAMGIVTSGSSCGGIVFPIMLNKIFQRSGFAWGVRSTGFVVLTCLVIANPLMRTRLPPKSKRPPTPPLDIKAIISDTAYLFTVLGAFLVLMGLFLPIFYIQLFSVVHGIDETLAFYSLAILNAASIFGRTIPNFVADKLGPFNLLIPCSGITAVLIFAMFGVKSSGALIVFSILYGFFSGAYVSLITPVVISLAKNMQEIGVRLGIAFAIVGFAALTGTPIAGALLTSRLQWSRPITFSAVVVLAGCAALGIARGIHSRRKGSALV
ncbi:transport protein [Ceratobasidium theobromae]|uniref:Transport protein n=1 Tax=Ceratobasidium theobromae TaxID=1582974 RepID=A0A5N5QLJ6_9AGAM|nr:transport protein [Ceratobasidium theobromae]